MVRLHRTSTYMAEAPIFSTAQRAIRIGEVDHAGGADGPEVPLHQLRPAPRHEPADQQEHDVAQVRRGYESRQPDSNHRRDATGA